MARSTAVSKTLREYSEASSVHGVSYVFSKSLPVLDRLLWTLLTLVALALAAYWSLTAYNNWQENLVTTNLKDTAKPVTSLPFPGVTICTSGLDMKAVTEQLMKDFTKWKRENNEGYVDRKKDKQLLEEYMRLKFEISDIGAVSIFDVLKAFHSPDPEKTRQSLSVLRKAIACGSQQQEQEQEQEEQASPRRKRSMSVVEDTGGDHPVHTFYSLIIWHFSKTLQTRFHSFTGELAWETSKNEFSDSECPLLKSKIKGSLQICKAFCLEETGCTAFNWNRGKRRCILRGCKLPVVPPATNVFSGFVGYWISSTSTGNYK